MSTLALAGAVLLGACGTTSTTSGATQPTETATSASPTTAPGKNGVKEDAGDCKEIVLKHEIISDGKSADFMVTPETKLTITNMYRTNGFGVKINDTPVRADFRFLFPDFENGQEVRIMLADLEKLENGEDVFADEELSIYLAADQEGQLLPEIDAAIVEYVCGVQTD